jgi:hypothetical protein
MAVSLTSRGLTNTVVNGSHFFLRSLSGLRSCTYLYYILYCIARSTHMTGSYKNVVLSTEDTTLFEIPGSGSRLAKLRVDGFGLTNAELAAVKSVDVRLRRGNDNVCIGRRSSVLAAT